MGKVDNHPLPVVQQHQGPSAGRRCSVDVSKFISFKCVAVLMLSVAAFVSALFWALPIRYWCLGFDAKESVKQSATVQAYFSLDKPVLELIPYIERLEYDLNGELGVPSAKVTVLSLHQEGKSNWTGVVFGFIPNPINSSIDSVPLTLLQLTLVDIFLKQYNLTVDHSLFGNPSSFEILKFPGGITIMPEAALIFQIHPALFRFNLNSSIYEIQENLLDLKKQLKLGLRLMPNEAVYIRVTSKIGSTIDPPVTVEASVVSDLGYLSRDRLKKLAQILTSPAKNLGLDSYIFGKVKGIQLSSFLKHSLHAPTPTPSPSPSPSPDPIQGCGPSPEPSASLSPQNQPHFSLPPRAYPPKPPLGNHDSPGCGSSDPPIHSPASHNDHIPPTVSPPASAESPLDGSTPHILPSPSSLPNAVHDSRGQEERSRKNSVSPSHVLSFSSSWSPKVKWWNIIGLIGVAVVI